MILGCELFLYIIWETFFSVKFKPCLFISLFISCLTPVNSTIEQQGGHKYISQHLVALDTSYTRLDVPPDHGRLPNLENVEKC